MSKIDLIIDYLDSIGEVTFAHQGFAGVERLNKALAAARELRELKPVAYINVSGYYYAQIPQGADPSYYTSLYALEVTK